MTRNGHRQHRAALLGRGAHLDFALWPFSLELPLMFNVARRAPMPAYVIAEHIITDPVKFAEYRTKVGPMMAKYGGRYLTKGAGHKMPEGGHWKPERLVVIEFPNMDSVDAWYSSAEYQPLIALREASTSDQDMLFFLEGA
jgi:uncharacterized protein (DUF1330 family)